MSLNIGLADTDNLEWMFKVVRRKNLLGEEQLVSLVLDEDNLFSLRYKLGERAIPEGNSKLFCFGYLKSVLAFLSHYDEVLLLGVGLRSEVELRYVLQPAIVTDVLLAKFWNNVLELETETFGEVEFVGLVSGSVFADWFIPLLKIDLKSWHTDRVFWNRDPSIDKVSKVILAQLKLLDIDLSEVNLDLVEAVLGATLEVML